MAGNDNNERRYKWFDTSAYGFQVAVSEFKNKGLLRLIHSKQNTTVPDQALLYYQLGFRQTKKGAWVSLAWTDSETGRIGKNLGEFSQRLQQLFPLTRRIEIPLAQIEGREPITPPNDFYVEKAESLNVTPTLQSEENPTAGEGIVQEAIEQREAGNQVEPIQEQEPELTAEEFNEWQKMFVKAINELAIQPSVTADDLKFLLANEPKSAIEKFEREAQAVVDSLKSGGEHNEVTGTAIEQFTIIAFKTQQVFRSTLADYNKALSDFNLNQVNESDVTVDAGFKPMMEQAGNRIIDHANDLGLDTSDRPSLYALIERIKDHLEEQKKAELLSVANDESEADIDVNQLFMAGIDAGLFDKPRDYVKDAMVSGQLDEQTALTKVQNAVEESITNQIASGFPFFESETVKDALAALSLNQWEKVAKAVSERIVERATALANEEIAKIEVAGFVQLPPTIKSRKPTSYQTKAEIKRAKTALNKKLTENGARQDFAYDLAINDGGSRLEALNKESDLLNEQFEDILANEMLLTLRKTSSLDEFSLPDLTTISSLSRIYPEIDALLQSKFESELDKQLQQYQTYFSEIPGVAPKTIDTPIHPLIEKIRSAFDGEMPKTFSLVGEYDLATGGDAPIKIEIEQGKLVRLTSFSFRGADSGWEIEHDFKFNGKGSPLNFEEGDEQLYFGHLRNALNGSYKGVRGDFRTLESTLEAKSEDEETPVPPKRSHVGELHTKYIGMNSHGIKVFEDDMGRYMENPNNEKTYRILDRNSDDVDASDFLIARANNDYFERDLRKIAAGYVMEAATKPLNKTDVLRYLGAATLSDPKEVEGSHEHRLFHEFAELATLKELRNANQNDKGLHDSIARLLSNQANIDVRTVSSARNQQYSTPAPLSVALNDILGVTPYESVLEPTIGNGSLVSRVLPQDDNDITITGFDLDGTRVDSAKELLDQDGVTVNIETGDFTKMELPAQSFDRMICNPPFGGMDKFKFDDGLVVQRIDYKIAAQALNALKDDGIGVMITGGDGYKGIDSGKIKGGSRYFYNWLSDNFAGVKVAEIDGSVYRRLGAAFPIRIAIVGGRGKSDRIPDDIPVLKSFDEVWEWSQQVKVEIKQVNEDIKAAKFDNQAHDEKDESFIDDLKSRLDDARGNTAQGEPEPETPQEEELEKVRFQRNSSGEVFVGHSENGKAIYENLDSVRFIHESGARVFEKIRIQLSRRGVDSIGKSVKERFDEGVRNGFFSDFITKEEIESHMQQAKGEMKESPASVGTRPESSNVTPEPETTSDPKADGGERAPQQPTPDDGYSSPQADLFGELQAPDVEVTSSIERAPKINTGDVELDDYLAHRVKDVPDYVIAEKRAMEIVAENDQQARYVPMSKGESSFMIPINQAHYANLAQASFMEKYGDPDEFVAEKLGYDVDDLPNFFSAEQIDSLALAISAGLEGRGFVVGDMTGIGKGRIMAGLIKYSVREFGRAVFVTEKANLFKDIYRDLSDIGVTDPNLFLLNRDTKIQDDEGKTLYSSNVQAIRKFEDSQVLPDNAEIVLMTYSQANLDPTKSKRARALSTIMPSSGLLLDEAHNAAGKGSNTNLNFRHYVEESPFTTYSTATYAKNAASMAFLTACFPDTVDKDNLESILERGGAAALEAVTSGMTAAGSSLVRQHDMSKLEIVNSKNEESFEFNKSLTDGMAKVIYALGEFSGEVEDSTEDTNQKLKKEAKAAEKLAKESGVDPKNIPKAAKAGITSTNFGSKLFNASRITMLLTNMDEAARFAIDALDKGQKPVIAMQNTMGSLLKEHTDFLKTTLISDPDSMSHSARSAWSKGEFALDREPKLTDVFHKLLDRMRTVKQVTGWGESTTMDVADVIDPAEYATVEDYERAIESLNQKIDNLHELIDENLPDISANPLDYMAQKIRDAGYSIDEVSGRQQKLNYNADDDLFYVEDLKSSKDKRNRVIDDYNNGKLDVIMLTAAGTTGISLHSSVNFDNQDRRCLVIPQPPLDINQYIQLLGRVNRNGQVNDPKIININNMMPSSVRLIAMLSSKLTNQSAATQSNRESKYRDESVVDILNSVGDLVVRDYLNQNPSVLNRLSAIGLKNLPLDEAFKPEGIASRTTGYISCLPYNEQVRFYSEVTEEFNNKLEELKNQGINPFESKVHDFRARIVTSELYQGVEQDKYATEFEKPVYLQEIEYDVEVPKISSDMIINQIIPDCLEKHDDIELPNGQFGLKGVANLLSENKRQYLEATLGKQFESVEEALKEKEVNRTQIVSHNLNMMIGHLNAFDGLGQRIHYYDAVKDSKVSAVVAAIRIPRSHSYHSPGQYEVTLIVPGENPVKMSLNSLMKNEGLNVTRFNIKDSPNIQEKYDKVEAGIRTRKRCVLTGNPIMCAQISVEKNMGEVSFFTDEQGSRTMGAIMPVTISKMDLKHSGVRFTDPRIVVEYIKDKDINAGEFVSTTEKYDEKKTITISRSVDGNYTISAPGTKKNGGHVWEDETLNDLMDKEFSGSRAQMKASFDKDNLDAVVDRLVTGLGVRFISSAPKARSWMNGVLKGLQTGEQLNLGKEPPKIKNAKYQP